MRNGGLVVEVVAAVWLKLGLSPSRVEEADVGRNCEEGHVYRPVHTHVCTHTAVSRMKLSASSSDSLAAETYSPEKSFSCCEFGQV